MRECGALLQRWCKGAHGGQGDVRQGEGADSGPCLAAPRMGWMISFLPEYRDFYSRRLNVKGFDRKGGVPLLTPTHHPVSSTDPALS